MPNVIQQVRMTAADANLYRGPAGQLIVDTDVWTIRVQDGIEDGGNLLLSARSNLADVSDVVIARKNLGLGSAALLEADVGFMLGENNLTEVADPEAARVNISAAKSGLNQDITDVFLNSDGLHVKNDAGSFVRTIKFDDDGLASNVVISLKLPAETVDIRLEGLNTGDQIISLTGDVAAVGSMGELLTSISAAVIKSDMIAAGEIKNDNIGDGEVSGNKLETIEGVAGTYNLASIQVDSKGRVTGAASGSFAGLITHKAVSPLLAATNGATFVHGFAALPDIVQVIWQCITAELGFAIGDTIMMGNDIGGTDVNHGATYQISPTNVTMHLLGPAGPVVVKSDGTGGVLNPANWNVKFTAISFS